MSELHRISVSENQGDSSNRRFPLIVQLDVDTQPVHKLHWVSQSEFGLFPEERLPMSDKKTLITKSLLS